MEKNESSSFEGLHTSAEFAARIKPLEKPRAASATEMMAHQNSTIGANVSG